MPENEMRFNFKRSSFPKGEALTAEEAESRLLQQLEDRGGTCKETLWQLAAVRGRMGRHPEALAHLQRLLQLTDDVEENASCFLALGQLMEQTADFAAAIKYYHGGLLLKPTKSTTSYWLNNNLGYCLNVLKRHEEAETYLRRAIKIAPNISNAYKNLALSFQGRSNYAKAARCFILAIKTNASDARPLKHLEELAKAHPEVLGDIPNLAKQIEMSKRAVEFAKKAQPDWEKHWKEQRRKQQAEMPPDSCQ
jgi:tetratricopeptide (TPR) repeat protein